MKILRTIIWVLAFVGFLIFAIYNWRPVELTLWQNLVLETKVPVLAIMAFAAGFVPMWAYHLSVKWGLNRRVRALENSLKHTALARHHEPQTFPAAIDLPAASPAESAEPLAPTPSDTGPQ